MSPNEPKETANRAALVPLESHRVKRNCGCCGGGGQLARCQPEESRTIAFLIDDALTLTLSRRERGPDNSRRYAATLRGSCSSFAAA